jgi:ankyrin repeat protein
LGGGGDGGTDDLLLVQGGRTALHSAAEEGHVDCVKFLADRGGRELIMATVQVNDIASLRIFCSVCRQIVPKSAPKTCEFSSTLNR